MENKAHALAAGIFVLLVSAMLVAMAVWLTRDTGEHRVYEISSPEAVNGLQSQAAVRYRGVAVGKVHGDRLRSEGRSAMCWCASRSTSRLR